MFLMGIRDVHSSRHTCVFSRTWSGRSELGCGLTNVRCERAHVRGTDRCSIFLVPKTWRAACGLISVNAGLYSPHTTVTHRCGASREAVLWLSWACVFKVSPSVNRFACPLAFRPV